LATSEWADGLVLWMRSAPVLSDETAIAKAQTRALQEELARVKAELQELASVRATGGEQPSEADDEGRSSAVTPGSSTAAALCDAAHSGDTERLRRLLDAGARVDARDYDGRTALHLASSENRLQMVWYLVETRADTNVLDRWGHTPLDDALRNTHDDVAAILTERGAKPGQRHAGEPAENATLLCNAAARGDVAALRQLMRRRGADANASDYDRRTALHIAAAEGQLKALEYLVDECGAEPSPLDRWGRTPLDDAVAGKHPRAERYLRDRGSVVGRRLLGRGGSAARLSGGSVPKRASVFSGWSRRSTDSDKPADVLSGAGAGAATSLGSGGSGTLRRRGGGRAQPEHVPRFSPWTHKIPIFVYIYHLPRTHPYARFVSRPGARPEPAAEVSSGQPRAALFEVARSEMLEPTTLRLLKTGWLRKLSKGGWTSNWNRRYFALAGSTLFYADSDEKIVYSPKVFADLRDLVVLQASQAPTHRLIHNKIKREFRRKPRVNS